MEHSAPISRTLPAATPSLPAPFLTMPQNLRAFIDDPAHFKPGVLMPAMHLNEHDLDAVTQYLLTLH